MDVRRVRTSMGWFYGFKLHLVVNDRGELLTFCLTPSNVNGCRPIPCRVRSRFGKLFGNRAYISQALAAQLLVAQGLTLITRSRQNIRARLLNAANKLLPRNWAIIESVNDQLKNVCQIEHARHRSPFNFVVHLLAGLTAYFHQLKKSSLHLD